MKYRIFLASVLKPVDDTRIFEKLATSLAKISNTEIFVAGYEASRTIKSNPINTLPIFHFRRLSLKRVFAAWKLWPILLKVKPQIVIPNTYELLGVMILYKILFGCKIVYDVQENYFRNAKYGDTFFWPLNLIVAYSIRLKELCSIPFISIYLLAEKCYISEMPYMKSKSIVIENKFQMEGIAPIQDIQKRPLKMIYSGTMAKSYGIIEAIELAEKLLEFESGEFTIIGYCPDQKVLKEIEGMVQNNPSFHLIGGDTIVPHKEIVEKIRASNLGIISYRDSVAFNDKMPTRIYEYLALNLPFLLPNNSNWTSYSKRFNSCLVVDYKNPAPESILEKYFESSFYNQKPGDEVLWRGEEKKLNSCISDLLGLAK